jgi:hypothetical protein
MQHRSYLIINQLLPGVVLLEHREEIYYIRVVVVKLVAWKQYLNLVIQHKLVGIPVPSKQRTNVLCSFVGGMVFSNSNCLPEPVGEVALGNSAYSSTAVPEVALGSIGGGRGKDGMVVACSRSDHFINTYGKRTELH